ncbi:antitermination protein, partial [Escherichia coli]
MNLEALPKYYSPKSPKLSDDAPATGSGGLTITDVMAAQGMVQSKAPLGFALFLAKVGVQDPQFAIEGLLNYAMALDNPTLNKLSEETRLQIIPYLVNFAFADYSRSAASKARCEHCAGNGKYTAQDATTAQKGIVQLSSATNSASETLAATPKAVKAANDNANGRVPSARKVNGKALSADITLTPKDIGTLNSTTMSFSGGAGWFKLATVTMPQASSIVYIALIGGAGYNVGSPHQAGISELVLRAGNGNPKGITGALWKRTAVGLTNFAWINTSG